MRRTGLTILLTLLAVAIVIGIFQYTKKPEPLLENKEEAQAIRDSLQAIRDSTRALGDSLRHVVDSARVADSVEIVRLRARIRRTTTTAAASDTTGTEPDQFWKPLYFEAARERDDAMRLLDRANLTITNLNRIIDADQINMAAADEYRLRAEFRIDSLETRIGVLTKRPKLLGILPLPKIQATCGYAIAGKRVDCLAGVGWSINLPPY